MNIYEVWTHARGEEAIEAHMFTITEGEALVFYGDKDKRLAAFSSGSWVSVRQVEETNL